VSEGSFFTDQRALPWLSRHEHGDSKVTGGDSAGAVLQRIATAAVMIPARVIAASHIISSLPCGEQKKHNPIE